MTEYIKLVPKKLDIYLWVVDFMESGCNSSTIKKLEELKVLIEKGFDSPATNSINVFGVNLFIFSYEKYLEIYSELKGV